MAAGSATAHAFAAGVSQYALDRFPHPSQPQRDQYRSYRGPGDGLRDFNRVCCQRLGHSAWRGAAGLCDWLDGRDGQQQLRRRHHCGFRKSQRKRLLVRLCICQGDSGSNSSLKTLARPSLPSTTAVTSRRWRVLMLSHLALRQLTHRPLAWPRLALGRWQFQRDGDQQPRRQHLRWRQCGGGCVVCSLRGASAIGVLQVASDVGAANFTVKNGGSIGARATATASCRCCHRGSPCRRY